MPFTYNRGIPASGNNPSADQPKMQTNTDSISSLISVDHFDFESGPDGEHKKVTFPENLTSVPGIVGEEGLLYTSLDSSSASQLNFKNKTATFPITALQQQTTNGHVTLVGGIILQWGTTALTGAVTLVTIPIAYSSTADFFNIQVSPVASVTSIVSVSAPLTSQTFNIRRSDSTGASVFWMTIGK